MTSLNVLDTVANLKVIPLDSLTLIEAERFTDINNLPPGQVGTIVEVYENGGATAYLVEFADSNGQEYAMATLKADELLALHYELTAA